MEVILRRREGAAAAGGVPRLAPPDELALSWPAVWQFLTLTQWADGERRETGSLTVFYQDGLLKACLADKDASLVAFVSADALGSLLTAVDRALSDDALDWRRAREQGGGRVRKSA